MDSVNDSSCQELFPEIKIQYPNEYEMICNISIRNKLTRLYYIEGNYCFKTGTGQKRWVDDTAVASRFGEYFKLPLADMANVISIIKAHLKKESDAADNQPTMSKAQFIEEFVKRHRGFVDHQCNFKGFPFANVDEVLQRDMRDYCKLLPKDYRFDWKDTLDTNIYKNEVSELAYEILREHIKFTPALKSKSLELATQLATIWRDPNDIPFTRGSVELDARVILHFIWNCKRRLHKLQTASPLFIIVHGAQGCGKSVALDKFLSPLTCKDCSFASSSSLDKVSDSRWERVHAKQVVLIIDELVGLSKAGIDKLKTIVTAEGSTFDRTLGTNNAVELFKYTSFIGSTNMHLSNLIRDDTGMRRWFHIYFPQTSRTKLPFDEVNNFPYLDLWRSVDQDSITSELSGEPWELELYEVQQTLSHKSHAEIYCMQTNLIPPKNSITKQIHINTIFSDYKRLCKTIGVTPSTLLNFRVSLQDLGVFITCKIGSKSPQMIYVNVSKLYEEYKPEEEDTPMESGELYE